MQFYTLPVGVHASINKLILLVASVSVISCATTATDTAQTEPTVTYYWFNMEETLAINDEQDFFMLGKEHDMDLRVCRNEANKIPLPSQMPRRSPPADTTPKSILSIFGAYQVAREDALAAQVWGSEYNRALNARSETIALCMEQKNYVSLSVEEMENHFPEIINILSRYAEEPLPRYVE